MRSLGFAERPSVACASGTGVSSTRKPAGRRENRTAYAWKKVRALLSKDRHDSRRFTCMTYNGDTIKQVGTMNRNLWVSACNPSLAATSNAHVLLPKHKWAEARGSSRDIDVQSDKYAEGTTAR